jgi:hypothetical protein
MKNLIVMLLVLFPLAVNAHEMTPTYPKLTPSHLDNVYKTTMEMFNKREDVEYYEIGVFDKDMNPIPFVTSYTILQIRYLGHVQFDIYIRKSDVSRAEYVCSTSKLRKDNTTTTKVTSKICSKFK